MRTLFALALATALAVPAATSPAAACGGDDEDVVRHTATGTIGLVHRNDDGAMSVFMSYPTIDGASMTLYGIAADLFQDRTALRLERDQQRWGRSTENGVVWIDATFERYGDTGAWRVVSYRLHRG